MPNTPSATNVRPPSKKDELVRTISQSAIDPAIPPDTRRSEENTEHPEAAESVHTSHDDDGSDAATIPADLEAVTTVSTRTPLYSVFSLSQKRFIVFMSATGGFFSAVSATIYFPALNALSADFNVSPTLINLTLTGYMIFQGAAPLLVGNLADVAGRRPAYIFCFVVYICANLGLALCPNYAALFVFRCLQSTGSSSTISLGSGVVADIADASERGVWMGFNTAGPNIAQSFGPVLGGVLAQFLGWRWIFWFLMILASAYLIPFVIFFPETSRNVVGNGSIPPQRWNLSLVNYLQVRRVRRAKEAGQIDDLDDSEMQPKDLKLKFPNPLNSLRLLLEKEIAILLAYNSIVFINYYTMVATTPYIFARRYGFNDLDIGLCYLPLGVGGFLAPIINGKLLDWNFRRTAAKLNLVIDRKRATDLSAFPLEKARVQALTPFIYLSVVAMLAYGWVMEYEAPLPAALVLQFIMGLAVTAAFGAINVLLVDLNPKSPSTVIAANNLTRCWIGAGATAVIIPAIEKMGTGGAFTLAAGLLLLCTPISYVLVRWGPGWREERRVRMLKEEEAREKRHQVQAAVVETARDNEKS